MTRFLVGTCLFAGSAGVAGAEVRSLDLINTHTQERASVVFKRDGVYDQNGLQELNRLLRDWRRNEVTRMDPTLFDLIWEVYRDTGARQPINIVCGYRSPATNNALRSRSRGVAKFSQHMLGKAMDFYLPDVNLSTLREVGMKKQAGGVGFYPSSSFVHMDTGSVRAWPRMTRDQLARLFPDGKTAHLPSDGQPLPGYQTALAEVEARKAHGGGPVSTSSSGGGLLAALFGGGSSAAPSRAVAGEDEEEVSTPAPRRAQQELRQGPPPPGSASRVVVARNDTTPPGVADLALPQNARPRPAAPQQVALAVAPPAPGPVVARPPVPTTTAAGSLVALPVGRTAASTPAPTTAAALPSRYGPANGELPPGWVQGPAGRPIAETAPAETRTLARVDVPLPAPRPGAASPAYTLAAFTAATPIAVALPRPRPTATAPRIAGLAATDPVPTPVERPDPHAAIAALTGDGDETPVAFGYAATAAATATPAGFTLASAPAQSEGRAAATASVPVQPAPPARTATPGAVGGKQDRFLDPLTRLVAKADRAAPARLFDGAGRTEGRDFAQMKHPDQASLDGLLAKPGVAYAAGFTTAALDDLTGARFSGPAVVALPLVRVR